MKNIIVILSILLLVTVIIPGFAYGVDIISTIEGHTAPDDSAEEPVRNIFGAIITIVQISGVGVAVIMLTVLAIKYMIASSGDKADIKKHATVYVIGAIVLFASTGILEIVKKFADNSVSTVSE